MFLPMATSYFKQAGIRSRPCVQQRRLITALPTRTSHRGFGRWKLICHLEWSALVKKP